LNNLSTKKKTKGSPNDIDIHVGQRLRVRRSLLGLSQEKLAESIGITFQQIQKYEKGVNRISASRLYQFSKTLQVPVSYFFEDLSGAIGLDGASKLLGLADNEQEDLPESGVLKKKETLDLVRVYYSIEDPEARKDVFKFIKSMAERLKDT